MTKMLFIANNNMGEGQSGGDTIFLNFAKYWPNVSIFGSQETKNLMKRYRLKNSFFKSANAINHTNYFLTEIIRSFIGWQKINNLQPARPAGGPTTYDFVYAVSDFYPDLIPAIKYKIQHPHSKLICGYYLVAPFPTDKNSPYIKTKQYLKGFVYWLSQRLSLFLVNKYADIVFITSQPDKKYFPRKKVIVVQGGVDIPPKIKSKKIYDAVFIGRLHPQKGALGLIDIWKHVVKNKPKAKLALIGNGALESQLKLKIKKYKLDNNIIMFGFKTGQEKYKIFSQSKIVLHPAIFDSGGMAACEAMSMGLPGVSYNLEALKTYYPQGMIKTKCFSQTQFANNIISLLDNPKLYKKYSNEALQLVKEVWLWPKRSKKILNLLLTSPTAAK